MKKTKTGKRIGRPPKHGGYSLIHRDELLKKHPYLRQYLEDSRAGLIRDLAGSEESLSEQQRIMIDRIVSRLSICRLIEIYIERYGVFRRDRIKRDKVLELEPALGINYLAFSNSIDRALNLLGLEKRQVGQEMTLAEVIKSFDEEKTAKEKKLSTERPEDERSQDDKGQDKGEKA